MITTRTPPVRAHDAPQGRPRTTLSMAEDARLCNAAMVPQIVYSYGVPGDYPAWLDPLPREPFTAIEAAAIWRMKPQNCQNRLVRLVIVGMLDRSPKGARQVMYWRKEGRGDE
jgi:hypothetical protein